MTDPKLMTDHKALAREMFGAIAGQDVDAAIDKYMAEDFVEHEDVPGAHPQRGGRRGERVRVGSVPGATTGSSPRAR